MQNMAALYSIQYILWQKNESLMRWFIKSWLETFNGSNLRTLKRVESAGAVRQSNWTDDYYRNERQFGPALSKKRPYRTHWGLHTVCSAHTHTHTDSACTDWVYAFWISSRTTQCSVGSFDRQRMWRQWSFVWKKPIIVLGLFVAAAIISQSSKQQEQRRQVNI